MYTFGLRSHTNGSTPKDNLYVWWTNNTYGIVASNKFFDLRRSLAPYFDPSKYLAVILSLRNILPRIKNYPLLYTTSWLDEFTILHYFLGGSHDSSSLTYLEHSTHASKIDLIYKSVYLADLVIQQNFLIEPGPNNHVILSRILSLLKESRDPRTLHTFVIITTLDVLTSEYFPGHVK